MNGKRAKEIRREIYGKEDFRKRQYFAQYKEAPLPFLRKLATLFRVKTYRVIVGGIQTDQLRQAYQHLKKQYKEVKPYGK